MGGGGSSGKADYPFYMKDYHSIALHDVRLSINAVKGQYGNPYIGKAPYNPDTDIAAMATAVSDFEDVAEALSPQTNWASFWGIADGKIFLPVLPTVVASGGLPLITTTVVEPTANPTISEVSGEMTLTDIVGIDSAIEDAITANNGIIDDKLLSDILPRYMAGMRDINAVHSSAFAIGRAIIEAFAQRDKSSFSANLWLAAEKDKNALRVQLNQQLIERAKVLIERDRAAASIELEQDRNLLTYSDLRLKKDELSIARGKAITGIELENNRHRLMYNEQMLRRSELTAGGTRDIMQLTLSRIEFLKAVAHYSIESNRIKAVLKKEQIAEGVELDNKRNLWDLELYSYGSNVLASISGAAVLPKGPSQAQSAVGGALSGAAAGAMAGMAMGPAAPLSMPMMALAGGAIGLGSSFL